METTQSHTALLEQDGVRATINERKFLGSMKHLFATSYSVIGELLQNARRAGASRIDFELNIENKTASIIDDGCGISDFQVLIALCDSGWDEQITLTDKPFGMGLFSLFFAADKVVFSSNAKRLEVCLDDIISKRCLKVHEDHSRAPIKGTRIDLVGLKKELTGTLPSWAGRNREPEFEMAHEIRIRVMGFALPVFINGQECKRPHAQENLSGVITPIGFVSYKGVTTNDPIINRTREHQLYLQGLPIGTSRINSAPIIVHLDSTKFTARMPDRSDLFDAAKQLEQVDQELKQMVAHRLTKLKADLPGEVFVQSHWDNCRAHGLMQLMNDIPWIPASTVLSVKNVSKDFDDVWSHDLSPELISRSDFLSGKRLAWFNPPLSTDDSEHAALVLKIMQQQAIIVVPREIDGQHWLRQMAPSVTDLKFTWTPHGVRGNELQWGDLGECRISLCDKVDVQVTSLLDQDYRMNVVINDGALLVPEGKTESTAEDDEGSYSGEMTLRCYVMGTGNGSDAVDALSDFKDQNDTFQEHIRDEYVKEWSRTVRTMKGESLGEMVKTVISDELNHLSDQQALQMALVRAVKIRTNNDVLINRPDVIDLMDKQFWTQVACALEKGCDDDTQDAAQRLLLAFTSVVQPGEILPVTNAG